MITLCPSCAYQTDRNSTRCKETQLQEEVYRKYDRKLNYLYRRGARSLKRLGRKSGKTAAKMLTYQYGIKSACSRIDRRVQLSTHPVAPWKSLSGRRLLPRQQEGKGPHTGAWCQELKADDSGVTHQIFPLCVGFGGEFWVAGKVTASLYIDSPMARAC